MAHSKQGNENHAVTAQPSLRACDENGAKMDTSFTTKMTFYGYDATSPYKLKVTSGIVLQISLIIGYDIQSLLAEGADTEVILLPETVFEITSRGLLVQMRGSVTESDIVQFID